jgi:mono/diheme cytochrome c family protein
VDALFFFLLAVSGTFSVLIATLIVYYGIKYRRKSPAEPSARITGSLGLEVFWSVVPFILAMIIFGWGVSLFFCSQYCGTNHSGMIGWVIVQEPSEYQEWLHQRAEGSLALEGRKLFLKYQCVSCHSADAGARAPVLEGLFGQSVPLRDGRAVIADETYLRESILQPDAKIVAGYEPIMPSYQGQLDEEEILKLVAFIKSLERGATPPRIDSAAPPNARPSTLDLPWRQP